MAKQTPKKATSGKLPRQTRIITASKKVFSLQFSKVGLLTALFFFALSLFPSLLPRGFLFQGILSGITAIIGYGIGVFCHWLWLYLGVPTPSVKHKVIVNRVCVGIVLFSLAMTAWQYVGWQNNLRDIFGQESTSFLMLFPTVILTVLVAWLFLIIGRSVRKLYHFLARLLSKYTSERLAKVVGVSAASVITIMLINGVLVQGFFSLANSAFSVRDATIEESVKAPESALRSGSVESEAKWDTLGKQGRRFVSGGPTASDINKQTGGGALEPIRVYAGLKSASDIESRADLLLDELIRTNAFDRKTLVLVTTTGTGWIDPKSVDPLEYVNNGDTAVAGVQYSYLPSWISLLADQEVVQESSRVTFGKIHDYWSGLPESERPKFYVYGLSLGSFGAESFLNSIELANSPIDGALLAGPPFMNRLHKEVEADRDPKSPLWQPIVNNGRTVRFTAKEDALNKPTGTWGDTKIIYLQHASDPVVWFSGDLLYKSPEWLEQGQRGPDISDDFVWIPVVTLWQVAADLAVASGVPNGYGHEYAPASNIDSWAALTQPDGWTTEKADALKAYFAKAEY
ncbi:MAG: alpha/beta-hydrolase family protein [Candidatus Saccharimonadales bacterium]